MFKIQKISAQLGVVAPHARALPARPPARPRHRAHAWYTRVRVGGRGVHGSGGV